MSDVKLPELQGPTESIMQALQRNHSELLAALRESAADKQRIAELEKKGGELACVLGNLLIHIHELGLRQIEPYRYHNARANLESELAIARDLIERHKQEEK